MSSLSAAPWAEIMICTRQHCLSMRSVVQQLNGYTPSESETCFHSRERQKAALDAQTQPKEERTFFEISSAIFFPIWLGLTSCTLSSSSICIFFASFRSIGLLFIIVKNSAEFTVPQHLMAANLGSNQSTIYKMMANQVVANQLMPSLRHQIQRAKAELCKRRSLMIRTARVKRPAL